MIETFDLQHESGATGQPESYEIPNEDDFEGRDANELLEGENLFIE